MGVLHSGVQPAAGEVARLRPWVGDWAKSAIRPNRNTANEWLRRSVVPTRTVRRRRVLGGSCPDRAGRLGAADSTGDAAAADSEHLHL